MTVITVDQEIGYIGIIEYSLILILSIISAYGATSLNSKLTFYIMSIFAILEIPRYVSVLNSNNEYSNKNAYACHLIGTIFFFLIYCCVDLLLDDALSFTKPIEITINNSIFSYIISILKRKKLLTIAIITFTMFVIGAVIDIYISKSLESSQRNSYFYFYTFIYVVYTIFYSTIICYLALDARKRISRLVKSGKSKKLVGAESYMRLMQTVIRKLGLIALACIIGAILRAILLFLKYLFTDGGLTAPNWLEPYGLVWWLGADFIPFGLPCFTFIYVFGVGSLIKCKSRNDGKEFTDEITNDAIKRNTDDMVDSDVTENPIQSSSDRTSISRDSNLNNIDQYDIENKYQIDGDLEMRDSWVSNFGIAMNKGQFWSNTNPSITDINRVSTGLFAAHNIYRESLNGEYFS